MILRSRVVLPIGEPPIIDGAVQIDGQKIVAVGEWSQFAGDTTRPVTDLGAHILMPGLINAHCHLDYSMFRHAISAPASFTAWVQRLNALKRSLDSEDYLSAIARGFKELVRWGTTTVCNIESFPELMPVMPPAPIRTWWFYEMIDVRHRVTSEEVVSGALSFFQNHHDSLNSFGLSPHAPYTASSQLYKMANECAANNSMALTTHVAESGEEYAMFRHGTGPLHSFMNGLNRPMDDCGFQSPFLHLMRSGSINSNWLLAHMNELDEDDFAVLAEFPHGNAPSIVHCPGSHCYFNHKPFAYRRLYDMGINLCVGTDSLASTDSLSLLRELRRLKETESWLTPKELMFTVTRNPARALKQEGRLGCITPNALADLIAIPCPDDVSDPYQTILDYTHPVSWMMINGKILS